jgi:hypothetical protein
MDEFLSYDSREDCGQVNSTRFNRLRFAIGDSIAEYRQHREGRRPALLAGASPRAPFGLA